ncbi:MAG TPA: hypothetical protein VGE92_16920, partial [Steroidobacteraceae bacterium]
MGVGAGACGVVVVWPLVVGVAAPLTDTPVVVAALDALATADACVEPVVQSAVLEFPAALKALPKNPVDSASGLSFVLA